MRFSWGVLILSLLLAAGCGHKGPVRPPQAKLPQAPAKVRLRQIGPQLVLSWQKPSLKQDGSKLNNLAGFVIYQRPYTPEQCASCLDITKLWRTIHPAYLQHAHRRQDRFYTWDQQVEPHRGYMYRLCARNSDGETGACSRIRRQVVIAPPPPRQLQAQAQDQHVQLRWQRVTDYRQGVRLKGYRIYRQTSQQQPGFIPLNEELITTQKYVDYAVTNGTQYRYWVRAVVDLQQQTVESPASEPATATPHKPRF